MLFEQWFGRRETHCPLGTVVIAALVTLTGPKNWFPADMKGFNIASGRYGAVTGLINNIEAKSSIAARGDFNLEIIEIINSAGY